MKSPFPGMDPYVEAHYQGHLWPDFQGHLLALIKDVIVASLPENYVAQTQQRVYHHLTTDRDTQAEPAMATSDPQTLRAFEAEEYRQGFLEIYEVEPEWRLVTCIEVLSPSNKRPNTAGWDLYLRKRQALLLGEASLVEIDLLRGGTRMPMYDDWPDSPYVLTVCRREKAPFCKVWRGYFDRPLPTIPAPLSAPHPDVTLELQPMIDAVYTISRYHLRIDYTRPLTPPLSEEQAAWLARRLRERAE
jgi:hypothetical protein